MMKNFRPAVTVLKEILAIEGSDKLETLLKIAECEMYLPDESAKESIQRAREFISRMKNSCADEVLEMAINARRDKEYVRSLILFHISYDLHQKENVSSDDAVKWIHHLNFEIAHTTQLLTDIVGTSRDIGIRYGLKFMEKLLKELREEKNGSPKIRAKVEVGSLIDISHILNIIGEPYEAIRICEEGIAIAEKQFGVSVSRYDNYGIVLNNLGEAYEKLEQFSKAANSYRRALKVYKKSSITSDYIERTTARLARIREKKAEKKKNFST